MKKSVSFLIAIAAVVVILLGWFIKTRNALVVLDEQVNNVWAQVETDYQRRLDLIPNLMKTVKASAEWEKGAYVEITEARSQAMSLKLEGNDLTQENIDKFQQLQEAAKQQMNKMINVQVEAYPELRSTEAFKDFMTQYEGTENRISVSRKNFNDEVAEFNKRVRVFPASIVANMCGFSTRGYFKSDEAAAQAPTVDFGF